MTKQEAQSLCSAYADWCLLCTRRYNITRNSTLQVARISARAGNGSGKLKTKIIDPIPYETADEAMAIIKDLFPEYQIRSVVFRPPHKKTKWLSLNRTILKHAIFFVMKYW